MKTNPNSYRIVHLGILVLLCVAFIFVKNKRWHRDNYKTTINSDGRGYYAFLPAAFIYHDFQYHFVDEVEQGLVAPEFVGNFLTVQEGKRLNKCFVGVAILQSPFFFTACAIEKLRRIEVTGYSRLFQYSVSIAALFYLGMGLYFLSKLLQALNISPLPALFSLIALVLGTNLFYYATMEPAMSHVYSFSLICFFLWSSHCFFQFQQFKSLLQALIVFLLILLVRPANGIILLAWPFLFGGFGFLKLLWAQMHLKNVLIALLLIPLILCIQPIIYFLQTGHYFVWSYTNEGFNFKDPHILGILLGFRKGLFIYTPLMAIAILSSIIYIRKSPFKFVYFLGFFLILTYILSSWWSWWYGGSFGLRAYVDFFGLFTMPLAYLLESINSRWEKILIGFAIGFCVFLNQFQIEQYNRYILHMYSMNQERYWKIFLSLDQKLNGVFYKEENPTFDFRAFKPTHVFLNDFESTSVPMHWSNNALSNEMVKSGLHAAIITPQNQYSATFANRVDSLFGNASRGFIKVTASILNKIDNTDAVLVVTIENAKGVYNYQQVYLQDFIKSPNKWEEINAHFKLENFKNKEDTIKIYFYESRGQIFIDDFKVELLQE